MNFCAVAKISVEREPVGVLRMNLQCQLHPQGFDFWLVHKSCANGAIKDVAKHTFGYT